MTDKPKQTLYIAVSEERSHGYFHLYARITTDSHERGARWPHGVDDHYSDGPLWSGLRASCQGDDNSQRSTSRENAVYGFGHVEYRDCHTVDLREARRMVKTIEKIDRGLSKLSDARGYARSYGEYIGRIAEVLGCKGIALERTKASREMTGEPYQWLSIGDGVNAVNNRVWQWQREAQDQTERAS